MKTINDYAELVKAEHALNKTIAPVEDGANIAGSYTSGKQFIRGGVLYTALTTIAANTAWSSLTLDTDYELADDITSQLDSLNQTLTNQVKDMNNVLGAKNLLPNKAITQESHGITFTVNSDGSVKANGTNDGTQVSSFFPYGDSRNLVADYFPSMDETYVGYMSASNALLELLIIWEDENKATISQTRTKTKVEFTIPSNAVYFRCDIRVATNATISNEMAYPMICLKSVYDLDGTFEPYAKTNRQLTEDSVDWNDMSQLGAVNFLEVTTTGTTTKTGGSGTVDFTVNADKSITINCDGTHTSDVYFSCAKVTVPKGSWKFSALQANSSMTYFMYLDSVTGITYDNRYDSGNGTRFNNSAEFSTTLSICVKAGTALNNVTIYPMIAPVDYNGDYVPYAKTNRELTEDVDGLGEFIELTLQNNTNYVADATSLLRGIKVGNKIIITELDGFNFKAGVDIAALNSSHANLISLPSGYSIIGTKAIYTPDHESFFDLTPRWSNSGLQLYGYSETVRNTILNATNNVYTRFMGVSGFVTIS